MKTVALACETIADEIRLAYQNTGSPFPVIWIDSGMHNYPDRLKEHLQSEINRIENVDYILLLFGYCGNSLLDLVSPRSRLVIPRVDDCISLLLGGNERRNRINSRAMSYYLTKGWLEHENNLWSEYTYCLNKYGPEQTKLIYKVMLENYRNLVLIDTGAYDLQELQPRAEKIAAELGLQLEVVKGSLELLLKAFRGDWDDNFVVIEAGRPVNLESLKLIEVEKSKAKEPPVKIKQSRGG